VTSWGALQLPADRNGCALPVHSGAAVLHVPQLYLNRYVALQFGEETITPGRKLGNGRIGADDIREGLGVFA
jgi:hypothetical protein